MSINSSVLLFILSFIISGINAKSGVDSGAAHTHCDGTLYPSLCTVIPNIESNTTTLPEIISESITQTADDVDYFTKEFTSVLRSTLDPRRSLAITDCLELLHSTVQELKIARSSLSIGRVYDLQTFLSAAMTNQDTCLDGLDLSGGKAVPDRLKVGIDRITRMMSNSLALTIKLPKEVEETKKPVEEKEALDGYGIVRDGFPTWVKKEDRRYLKDPIHSIKIDLVVSKDGTGNFTTITDAVAAAPTKSKSRFVIYIKAGGYYENVDVSSKKYNLMFIGDGMWKTSVKSNKNVVDGSSTYRSATVAVNGKGFLARDITFENYAGPSKHQAVAFRSSSDKSAFYRCSFAAYQDTLYVHKLRQFYRDCDVYGTVDFIFGNSAVVMQNCNLYARKPDPKQKNVFTAQGRKDPNQNTGISIQDSKIAAAADLIPVKDQFKSYLGRPWKKYSRTVILQTNIEDLIDPAGWLEWKGEFALDTLYYGEYMNVGAGSDTSRRVTWPGYRVIKNSSEAAQFTVNQFIQGDEWLCATTFPYTSGLSSIDLSLDV
ncbi:putative pectin methylesterase inhibitory protein [Zostera marina]|uniref:Pectinesterase n=1 Tax=Zostera marina TaxID=29655 RepID=A0A0K9NVR8_ZOSMR|nr:putative pectin methylesterase inhibitory protein [Zostera marina]